MNNPPIYSSRVRIAHLKPHPLHSFIYTTCYYFFLPVAYWVSFSGMVVVRDAHPTTGLTILRFTFIGLKWLLEYPLIEIGFWIRPCNAKDLTVTRFYVTSKALSSTLLFLSNRNNPLFFRHPVRKCDLYIGAGLWYGSNSNYSLITFFKIIWASILNQVIFSYLFKSCL